MSSIQSISEVTPPTEEVLEPLAGERRLLPELIWRLSLQIVFARIDFFMCDLTINCYCPNEPTI